MKSTPASLTIHPGVRVVLLCVGLVLLVGLLYSLKTVTLGDSANSRLATVYALTHEGTWYIDSPPDRAPNPFAMNTVDKVELQGRMLSTKPPILPLLMTGEYVVLRSVLGWDLSDRTQLKHIVQGMVLGMAIVPFIIILIIFARFLEHFIATPWRRIPPFIVLALGTQLPGFATQISNHIPGTCAMMLALYFALVLGSKRVSPTPWRFMAFGFFGGLTFTLDMPLTVFIAAAGLYLIFKFPRQAILYSGVAMALPLLVHFAVMIYVTGSPLPIQMRKELYFYEGAFWRSPSGLDGLNEPKGIYGFHILLGRFGLFLLFPVLITGVVAVFQSLQDRSLPWRGYILGGFTACVLLSFYYIFNTNNYGGSAYGFRWYIGVMPVLLMMSAPVYERMRAWWAWGIWVMLFGMSMYSAWECFQAPWGSCHEWTVRLIFGAPFGSSS